MNLLPAVIYPDVVNYLLFAQRPYTAEQQLWSRTITLWFSQKKFGNMCSLVGRVSHFQKLSETPRTAWVIAEMGDKVHS